MTEFGIKLYDPNADRAGFRSLVSAVCHERPGLADSLLRQATGDGSIVYLARREQDDVIVGFAELHPMSKYTVLHRIAVHPEFRRQGGFTALLSHVLASHGARELHAEVCTDAVHYPAMLRSGFAPTKIERGYRAQLVRKAQGKRISLW